MALKRYLFCVSVLLSFVCAPCVESKQIGEKRGEEPSVEAANPLDLIPRITEKNIVQMSKKLWATPQLSHILKDTQNALEVYGKCGDNAYSKLWSSWRNSPESCGSSRSVDDFRRTVVLHHFTNAVNSALQVLEAAPVTWTAIGTLGPGSDVDIVACAKEREQEGVKIAEMRAKVLFDTLCVAIYGKTAGEAFDTECYVDVVYNLRGDYRKLIQNKTYQNLAFTLSQVQVFRQLEHPISFQGNPIFSWKNYIALWSNASFQHIVLDARRFNEYVKPREGALKNLGHYLPIAYQLAQAFHETHKAIAKAIIAGIQGTYFPEGYYTNEALKHVCYSDDRYSQLLLTLIRKELETRESLSIEDIEALIEKENLDGITPFVYAVSAGENLGYFLHKLHDAEDALSGLINASKYLFRVARALCSYLQIDTDAPTKNWKDSSQEYAYRLFEMSSKFERLKRGVVPFTTQQDIHKILYGSLKSFKISTARLETLSHAIYSLFIQNWSKLGVKKDEMSALGIDVQRFGIFWDDESSAYEVDAMNDGNKKDAAHKLAALLNLAIGVESKMSDEQVDREARALKKSVLLPLWQKGGEIHYKKLSQVSAGDFKDFFVGLILFYRDIIIKDYAKTSKHTFKPLNLKDRMEEISQDF